MVKSILAPMCKNLEEDIKKYKKAAIEKAFADYHSGPMDCYPQSYIDGFKIGYDLAKKNSEDVYYG